jgi:NAD(P)-dependent dehydrogenase (short-subunit alcohol dehydrogenase family)
LKRIKKSGRSETVRYEIVELSDLNSVRAFAKKIEDEGTNVDILINNAGIMMKPHNVSAQGFEIHLAINYLRYDSCFQITLE